MDLRVNDRLTIPGDELRWSFTTSGGPGGQHANRSATRAELTFDIAASPSLPAAVKDRLIAALGRSEIVVRGSSERSQWRNRQTARRRLAGILEAALRPPPPPRRSTAPSQAARRRRMEEKRRRGEVKQARRPPEIE